jgi:cadmium resistance protein CadD (predicted permease)
MESLLALLGLAIILFASTNIDDLVILVGFFADPAFRPSDVVAGQCAGVAALFSVSLALSLLSMVIPKAYIGLLGIFPILIGVRKLLALRDHNDELGETPQSTTNRYGQMAAVALVTIANGGDNVGIYVPAFAVQTGSAMVVIAIVFFVMTALWCYLAHWLVSHPKVGPPIRNYARLAVPVVLIGLGFLIMYQAGSFAWGLRVLHNGTRITHDGGESPRKFLDPIFLT